MPAIRIIGTEAQVIRLYESTLSQAEGAMNSSTKISPTVAGLTHGRQHGAPHMPKAMVVQISPKLGLGKGKESAFAVRQILPGQHLAFFHTRLVERIHPH